MASNREQFTTEIYVNQEQANDAMGKLRDKVNETAKAYEKLLNSKDADSAKTEKARKAWEQAKASLANVEKGVDEYRRAMDNLTGKSMDSLLRMQRQINSELKKTKPNTEEWKRLSKQYGQVTDRIRDLKKSQSEMMSGMGKLRQMAGNVTSWFNKFGTAIVAIPLAFKKLTGAMKAVIDVTKQVVNASQSLGDKWNNGMKAMKTATDAFFFSLSTGDWSAFNDGITGALKKARELAGLMDLMGSYEISNMYMQTEYETAFREAMADYNDPSKTEKEREEALGKAEKALTDYKEFLNGWGTDTQKALIEAFNVRGIDYTAALDEENEEAQAAFDHFFDELYKNVIIGNNKVVNELNDLNEDVRKKGIWATLAAAFPSSASQEAVDNFTEATQNLAEATQAATEEERNLRLASQLNDETLTGLIQTYQKQREATRKAARLQNTYNNAIKGGTTATDAYTEVIKKVDKAEAAQLTTLKRLYANGLMDKQAYEAQKAAIEEDYLKQRLATAEQYGKDTDQFMNQLLDRQIARMEKAREQMKEIMDGLSKVEKSQQKGKEEKQLVSEKDDVKKLGKKLENEQEILERDLARVRERIGKDTWKEELEFEMWKLKELHDQGVLAERDYQQAKLKIKLEYAQKAAEQVNSIAEQASNFVTALREMESAQLEAQYQADLTAAGDNAEKREQIENEYEQKQLDLKKKYADTEMAINIAKTIAAGAVAAIKAYAEGGPYLGIALAALIAATTAAEVATIIAQRNAIKNTSVSSGSKSAPKTGKRTLTGYAEGGYTEDHTTLTTVGERGTEWVAPAWMVRRNPVMIANLERYRKAGSHGRSGSMERGFADGGFTGKGGGPSTGSGTAIPIADIEAAMEAALRRVMQDGAIRAYLVRKDLTELDAQDARFRKQTSR